MVVFRGQKGGLGEVVTVCTVHLQDGDLYTAGLSFRALLLGPGQKQASWCSPKHHTDLGGPLSNRHRVHPLQLRGEDLHLQGASAHFTCFFSISKA